MTGYKYIPKSIFRPAVNSALIENSTRLQRELSKDEKRQIVRRLKRDLSIKSRVDDQRLERNNRTFLTDNFIALSENYSQLCDFKDFESLFSDFKAVLLQKNWQSWFGKNNKIENQSIELVKILSSTFDKYENLDCFKELIEFIFHKYIELKFPSAIEKESGYSSSLDSVKNKFNERQIDCYYEFHRTTSNTIWYLILLAIGKGDEQSESRGSRFDYSKQKVYDTIGMLDNNFLEIMKNGLLDIKMYIENLYDKYIRFKLEQKKVELTLFHPPKEYYENLYFQVLEKEVNDDVSEYIRDHFNEKGDVLDDSILAKLMKIRYDEMHSQLNLRFENEKLSFKFDHEIVLNRITEYVDLLKQQMIQQQRNTFGQNDSIGNLSDSNIFSQSEHSSNFENSNLQNQSFLNTPRNTPSSFSSNFSSSISSNVSFFSVTRKDSINYDSD